MNEEDIIARARQRQEIASRRHELATQRMGRVWVSAAIAVAIIGAFLLAPGALPSKLLLAISSSTGLGRERVPGRSCEVAD